jgi:poly(3-hydroxybutyrate) depolymerase
MPLSYDPARPTPLLSVFHGQGDSGANMRDFWTTVAETGGFIVLATSSTGSSGGWVPAADVPRYDAALTDALGAYNLDTSRLYVWGFSAGAHLAHAIGLENANTFAAYSVSAGVLAALEGVDGPTRASRHIPVDIHIGMDDPLFPQASSDRSAFLAAGWREGTDLSYVTFVGGHTVRAEQLPEIWAFLSRFRL